MRLDSFLAAAICVTSTVEAFTSISVPSVVVASPSASSLLQMSENQYGEEEPRLVLNDIDKEMAQFRSKYPTSEADFLAAARARAAARTPSTGDQASAQDWAMAQEEARKRGIADDWENSAKEAGNIDSQILIPVEYTEGADPDDEPQLML